MLKISQHNTVTRIDSARTFAGRGHYWTTAYLIDDLLVDTGCAHTAVELVNALEGHDLTYILNTHTHEDHIGANNLLQKQHPALKIHAHPLALPILEKPHENQPLQSYRRLFWGWPKPSQGQSVEDGEIIETPKHRFRVIYTPGHSTDHVCLYEPDRGWLFSGDLFAGGKDRALRLDCDIWQMIESLKRIVTLPLTVLFPGCARIRENPIQEINAKIAYLETTGEKVLALHHKGWQVNAIARSLFGRPMYFEFLTQGDFSRRGLVQSYLKKNVIK